MKFQKTAIAVTIAGFAAAPMMASADTVLSGVIQVKVQGTDEDGDAGDPRVAAGDIRTAISSEHELNSGLIGYGNIQLNLDDLTGEGGGAQGSLDVDGDGSITDEEEISLNANATVASDNVYVGIKGGFGDVRIGEIPLAVEYGQLANDIHDVGADVEDGISYTGTFGIFGIGLNFSPEAGGVDDNTAATNSDMIGAGVKFNFAGATIGLGFEDRAELTNFAIGGSYAIAGFSIAAHAWSKGQLDFESDDDGGDVTTVTVDQSLDDQTAFAVQVGYGIAGVNLGVTFSVLTTEEGALIDTDNDTVLDAVATGETEETIIRFDAGYDLGGGTDISTRIQNKSTDAGVGEDPDDLLEWRVMLSKNF